MDKTQKIISLADHISSKNHSMYIAAIGASAGGLEALKIFFSHTQPHPKLSFVVITHLNPEKISTLPELLQQYTTMPVLPIVNYQKVEPSHVYVLPPGKSVFIRGGILHLSERNGDSKFHPIDFFLRSLANDQGSKSICIILSGTGNDGTIGLSAIRKQGGLILVQTTTSARYDSMPKSAINTGLVDYTFIPQKMYAFLATYLAHKEGRSITLEASIADEIQQILSLLRSATNHDFSHYKPNTIFRRIQKRLGILQLDTLSNYIQYIKHHPNEIQILFKELLINVTSFFRDPEAFAILKEELLKNILKKRPQNEYIRVWVPGCATGEEAYSIAIILLECMEQLKRHLNIQIFGTDIDAEAIEIARTGIFPIDIKHDLSEERLNRFFVKEENSYKVNIDIRKMIIFATQNLIKDPPFTKLDLLSCRNLLIYLNSQLQKRIFSLFHYSLKPDGLLFLGTSEAISGSIDLFTIIDRRWKIFQRKWGTSSFNSVISLPSPSQTLENIGTNSMEKNTSNIEPTLAHLVERILLENYTPACVVLDENGKIIYIYGRTGKFLEFPSGEARFQFIEMIRPELKSKVMSAIQKVSSQQKEEILKGLSLKEGTDFKYINITIRPIFEAKPFNKTLLLIVFEEEVLSVEQTEELQKHNKKNAFDKRIVQLEQELKYTKESLQTTIEELETSNEELKSSNEELQSTNEELQSTNEEIETSKEELQSLNEELTTVNAELESRIEQLSSANDDIKNLLDNTEIATIFLDKDLCIKRFTPRATDIINLIPTDVGRPISHIVSNLEYGKLMDDARSVLKTLESKTAEVQDKSGHWYVIRIIPYRTVTNIIDGVVITFLNIHNQKKAENDLIKLKEDYKSVQTINLCLLGALPHAAMLLDKQYNLIQVNDHFIKKFNFKKNNLIGENILKLKLSWDKVKLKQILNENPPKGQLIEQKLNLSENNTCSITVQVILDSVILLVLK